MSEGAHMKAGKLLLGAAVRYPKIRGELGAIVPPEDVPEPYRRLYERALDSADEIHLDEFALDLEVEEFDALLEAYEDLPTSAGAIAFAERYARWRRERAVRLQVMQALQEWTPQSQDSLAEVLSEYATRAQLPAPARFDLATEIDGLREEIIEAIDGQERVGISCGLAAVDDRTRGLRPGALWVLSGRASHGKTQLALAITHTLLQSDTPVSYFSLEMGVREVLTRLLAIEGRLGVGALLAGEYRSESQIQELAKASERAKQRWSDLLVVLDSVRTPRRIRQLVVRNRPRVWFLDWLGLLSVPGPNRAQILSETIYALKGLAMETGTTGVILHQLNREIEHRGSWEPRLSDLKDSGGVEEAADVVLAIVRSAYTSRDVPQNAARLYLLKNRLTGQLAKLSLICDWGLFYQSSRQEENIQEEAFSWPR